jgi:hypothetical protein
VSEVVEIVIQLPMYDLAAQRVWKNLTFPLLTALIACTRFPDFDGRLPFSPVSTPETF